MYCQRCQTPNPDQANFCGRCGAPLGDAIVPAVIEQGDATGGLIPYKNVPALVGYYLGVFSLIPFLGVPLALVAIPLGIAGLVKRKNNPAVRGAAHAIVAIVLGIVSLAITGGIVALMFNARRW